MSYQELTIGIRGICNCGFDLQFLPSADVPNVFETECKACNRVHAFTVTANVSEAVLDETDAQVAVPSKAEDQSPVARMPRSRK